jgi:hypothetical protein
MWLANGELRRTPLWRSSQRRESLHSPTPIGPGDAEEGAHIVGYYAPAAWTAAEKGLGHWGEAKRRAGAK